MTNIGNRYVPNPLLSDQQYLRFYHYDLAGMEIEDLLSEVCSLRCRLWLLKSDRFRYLIGSYEQGRRIEWLRERVSRIEAELRKQRYATWEIRSQPKSKPKLMSQGVKL